MIGIMVDSEGTQLTQRSETMNNGEIIMSSNSSQSIGIDFGQYQSSLSQTSPANPYVIVRSGNITINGSNSYGVRVGDMFSSSPRFWDFSPRSWYLGIWATTRKMIWTKRLN